ncbi:MAG TPA: hypothetical protein VMF67_05600 [Rhizomicrobium sp.]|nr:hypothetical protein [Rhizomicrobium sp.]
MERPQQLRKLADWYRGFAEAGRDEDRAWRIGFAEYLEKVAAEIEFVQGQEAYRQLAARPV